MISLKLHLKMFSSVSHLCPPCFWPNRSWTCCTATFRPDQTFSSLQFRRLRYHRPGSGAAYLYAVDKFVSVKLYVSYEYCEQQKLTVTNMWCLTALKRIQCLVKAGLNWPITQTAMLMLKSFWKNPWKYVCSNSQLTGSKSHINNFPPNYPSREKIQK